MSKIWNTFSENDLWNYIIWHYIMDQRQLEIKSNPHLFNAWAHLPQEEYMTKCADWIMRDPTDQELKNMVKCLSFWKDKNWLERLEEIADNVE